MLAQLSHAAAFAVLCCSACLLHDASALALTTGTESFRAGLNPSSNGTADGGSRDLAFMHIPYNFGHTIEAVALFRGKNEKGPVGRIFGPNRRTMFGAVVGGAVLGNSSVFSVFKSKAVARMALRFRKPTAEIWGHANPELFEISRVTKCPLYFTPQKYWPEYLADKYFGTKTVFGVLRDPYERLVAMFRGNFNGYGGGFSKTDFEKCDVNNALKKLMKKVLNDTKTDPFTQKCAFIPQAEYFDGKYGITLPINNRAFPDSMNEVFQKHGYTENVIYAEDVYHVFKCNHVWAADLDHETKGMIRQYFTRDFELLCRHFDYCDDEANTCIPGVKQMCPPKVLKAGLVSLKPTSEDYRKKQISLE